MSEQGAVSGMWRRQREEAVIEANPQTSQSHANYEMPVQRDVPADDVGWEDKGWGGNYALYKDISGITRLSVGDVVWGHKRFWDKNYMDFIWNDTHYKMMLPTAQAWMKDKMAQSLYRSAAKEKFIPDTLPAEIMLENYQTIYKQKTEYFNVEAYWYCPEMLKDAALLWLDFNLFLLKKGMGLWDGHHLNLVVQDNAQVKWCDIGSIVMLHGAPEFIAIKQFIQWFFYPLVLRAKCCSSGKLMRTCLRHEDTLTHDLFSQLHLLDQQLIFRGNRLEILTALRENIASLDFEYEKTMWRDYRPPQNWDGEAQRNRDEILLRVLKALNPKTVIEIGANSGRFSCYAGEIGAEVLCMDPDEGAISQAYRHIRGTKLNVKPIVAGLGEKNEKPADLAIALALTHHLFISQHYPWSYIAHELAAYSAQNLITEYMPNGLHGKDAPPDGLPPGYSLEAFQKQLARFFSSVELIDYPPLSDEVPRIFLLCRNKKNTADAADRPHWYFQHAEYQ